MHVQKGPIEDRQAKRPRKIKLGKWILIALLVIVLLLFFTIPAFLSSERGRNFIISRINSSVDGKVDIGSFSFGWFKGLRVTDFTFTDNHGKALVNVKEIFTRPVYTSLVFGQMALGKTVIKQPEIVINLIKKPEHQPDDTSRQSRQFTQKKNKTTVVIPEKIDLELTGGSITINSASQNGRIQSLKLKDIESKVNLKPAGSKSTFDIALQVENDKDVSTITAKGTLKPSAKKSWTLKGTSGDLTARIDNLDLGSLAPVFAIMGRKIDAGGKLNAQITAKIDNGRFENLQAKAVLSELKHPFADVNAVLAEPVVIDAKISSDAKGVKIDNLSVESSFCRLSCLGRADSVDYVATANLGQLQQFAGQFADFGDYTVVGAVTIDGRMSFDAGVIKAVGNTVIEKFVLSDGKKAIPQTSAKLDFDIALEADKNILRIGSIKLQTEPVTADITDSIVPKASQIDITGNFSKNTSNGQTKLTGRLQTVYELAAVNAAAGAFIPQGLKMSGKRNDSIKFESRYPQGQADKLLANLSADATFGFDSAEYMGLGFSAAETKLQIKKGLLQIAPFSTRVNNGRLQFAASADFNQKPTMLQTPGPMQIIENVNINDETCRQILKYVNPVFADAVNVSGVANFHCEQLSIPLGGAAKDELLVIGTIEINKMHLEASDLLGQIVSVAGGRGADLTLLPTKFVLQNGRLSYDDMQINVGDNPVNFSGVIGLDKSLDMTVTLPYTFAGRTVRVGQDSAERVSLPIEGSLDNPNINMKKLLEKEAQKLIETEGRKLLEKLFDIFSDITISRQGLKYHQHNNRQRNNSEKRMIR